MSARFIGPRPFSVANVGPSQGLPIQRQLPDGVPGTYATSRKNGEEIGRYIASAGVTPKPIGQG
ncbi:MAG: hypothetical protein HRT47_06620 [Candidatus Caenarcaniphilales bacterium]|nr:hypothetical protein [Candidatus Caenarcaniphilales bacterium]